MKIAISTDGNFVSAHFGRCPSYTIVNIENNKIVNKEIIDNPGHQPGFIPQFLQQKNVDCIICGGMGSRAASLFEELGIKTIVGISGQIDEAIKKFLQDELQSSKNTCAPESGKGYGLDKQECDHLN